MAYLVFVTQDNLGNTVFGPPIILNNNRPESNQPQFRIFRPVSTVQANAILHSLSFMPPRELQRLWLNNIMSVHVGANLNESYASSHLIGSQIEQNFKTNFNSIVFKPDTLSTVSILTTLLAELYEIRAMAHFYSLGEPTAPPAADSGANLVLLPPATVDLVKSNRDWAIVNGLSNLLQDLQNGSIQLPDDIQSRVTIPSPN